MKKIYSADELIKSKPDKLDILELNKDGSTMVKTEGASDSYYKNVSQYKMTYDQKFASLTSSDSLGDEVTNYTALYGNNNCEEDRILINKIEDNKYIISVIDGKEKIDK